MSQSLYFILGFKCAVMISYNFVKYLMSNLLLLIPTVL